MTTCLRWWAIVVLSLILALCLWTCSTKNLTGTDKTGSIFVNSVPPDAEIYLDGDSTGNQTPHTLFDVRVGNHVVSVKMDGYLSSPPDSLIRVDEGKIDTVEFVLLKTSYGSLKVSSNVDGATICIDKKPKNEVTPHVFFNSVPVGTHIISIFKEGYSNENPAKEIVTITTGDTAEVHFTLNPAQLGKAVGNITPDFDLQDADLFRHRLYAYRGFVTIINFWAEDCTYCMEELPHLQEIYTEYRSDSLIIFGINYGGDFGQEGFDVIRRIRDEKQLDFILLKGAGTDVKSDYGVTSTPVTIILDRGGKIYYYIVGFYSPLPGKLRQKLDELFGK
jgi:thiol-disulfide isomerase/thioredoxin